MTGSSGFVGRWLAPALRERYPQTMITCLNRRPDGRSSADNIIVDLLDAERLTFAIDGLKPDLVIHLAAQSSIGRAHASANSTWVSNVSGSLNLALAVADCAPRATVLFASTAEVYGASFLGGPASELTPLQPMNAYAKSKALAERMFADVLPETAQLIIARPFNHTGPGQSSDFVLPSFAGQIARIEAGSCAAVVAVGNLEAQRDFLDVRDVVGAYLALIEKAPTLPMRFAVNIASGRAWPLSELLEKLRELARIPFVVKVDPARLRRVELPIMTADPSLLKALTGWRLRYPIERTLSDILESCRAAPP